jgi:hypothetical protein
MDPSKWNASYDGKLEEVEEKFLSKKKILNLGITGLAVGSTVPSADRTGNFFGYSFDINDDGFVQPFEIPYDWDGKDVKLKIHWHINEAYSAASGEVRWNIKYTACKETGMAVDSETVTLDFGDVSIPAIAKHLIETEKVIIASALGVDRVIGMQVTRVALSGGTDPTADPVIIGLELEYGCNKLGED